MVVLAASAVGAACTAGVASRSEPASVPAGSAAGAPSAKQTVTAQAGSAEHAADRAMAGALAQALKMELQAALRESPEAAIAVCHERAPQISSRIGAEHGVRIGRTALRVRNPDNEPLPWQREVLEDFARRQAAGEPLASMEYSASVELGARTEHRYMKAIVTEPLCVTCHGSRIDPALQRAIVAKYPNDAATGFEVGDLRGAVYVVR